MLSAEDTVVSFIEKLHAIMSFFNFNWEIILVANYWPHIPDKTPDVVRTLCERLPHTRYVAKPKQGDMGWDMKSGLDACEGRYIGVIDGDGQYLSRLFFPVSQRLKTVAMTL